LTLLLFIFLQLGAYLEDSTVGVLSTNHPEKNVIVLC